MDGPEGWSSLEKRCIGAPTGLATYYLTAGLASITLRIAAGVGRIDLTEVSFASDGSLKPEAGKINWLM